VDACPDLSGADEIFLTIRAYRTAAEYAPLLSSHRHDMKPEAVGEIEAGMSVSRADLERAIADHARLMERIRAFQERYEVLACAVNQVPPFDASLDWPKSIAGVAMGHYVAWMKSAYWISVTCRPAISVPAGFTPEGLPVGIQLVGRERDDWGVLRFAHAFEAATGFGRRRPVI
jgi:amidase